MITTARHQIIPVTDATFGVTTYEVVDTHEAGPFDVVARFFEADQAEAFIAGLEVVVTTATLTARSGLVNPIETAAAPAGYATIRLVWHTETFHYLFPFDGRTVTGPAVGRVREVAPRVFTARTPGGEITSAGAPLRAALASLVA